MSAGEADRNPYDFVRPVTALGAFAGRKHELKDIDYYLDQTKQGLYVNLAFIGPRASGKTSLLNMVRVKAQERGFLVVKIDLDADMVTNELLFFSNFFDSIVSEGVRRGMLGGLADRRFETFRRQIDMADAKTDPVNEALRFGRLYATSVSERKVIHVSQMLLKHDFSKLAVEAAAVNIPTIVALFDECDLFSRNEALLQKLKNVFTEVQGYLLAFSGTERMFPVLNEVFSPIPMQFKKIPVLPFEDEVDTRQCIIGPARDASVSLSDIGPGLISELHTFLAGARMKFSCFAISCFVDVTRLNLGDSN